MALRVRIPPCPQNGIAGFLFGKQGWHMSVILQVPFYAEIAQLVEH